jgi:hypothetical protein
MRVTWKRYCVANVMAVVRTKVVAVATVCPQLAKVGADGEYTVHAFP